MCWLIPEYQPLDPNPDSMPADDGRAWSDSFGEYGAKMKGGRNLLTGADLRRKAYSMMLTAIILAALGLAGPASLVSGASGSVSHAQRYSRQSPNAAPCYTAFPNAGSRTIGRTTWYNRQGSVRMVLCYRFGLEPSADFPISASMICGMLAQTISLPGGKSAEKLSLFTDGACSGADLASDPREPVKYVAAVCSWASDLLGIFIKPVGVAASLGCAVAPSVGASLGAMFESKHEFDVARDVIQRGMCIKRSPTHFGSPWLAVKCAPGDQGFSNLSLAPAGDGTGGSGGDSNPLLTNPDIKITNLNVGSVPAGHLTTAQLIAVGGTPPYIYSILPDSGNVGRVPSWVHLASDGTLLIDPPVGTNEVVGFYVYATDAGGEESPHGREEVTFSVVPLKSGSGMLWSAINAPTPPDGISGTGTFKWNAQVNAACNGSDTCVLPGSYQDSAHAISRMIAILSGGSWAAISPPVPSDGVPGTGVFPAYPENYFTTAPECVPAPEGICVVLGEYTPNGAVSGGRSDMIDTLSKDDWSSVKVPVPVNGEAGSGWVDDLDPPACSEANTCVVLGGYFTPDDGSGSEERTMLVFYAKGQWQAVEAPVVAGGYQGTTSWFLHNSETEAMGEQSFCLPSGVCYAIGEYASDDGSQSVIEKLNDGQVSASAPPVPTGGQPGTAHFYNGSSFGGYRTNEPIHWCSGVSCVVPGEYEDAGGEAMQMLLSLNHGLWEASSPFIPPNGRAGTGSAGFERACSIEACVVVGEYEEEASENWPEMLQTFVNGNWSATDVPVPSNSNSIQGSGNAFQPVCSYGKGLCLAPGDFLSSSEPHQRALADVFTADSWTSNELPVPAGSGKISKVSVGNEAACTDEGACVVMGSYERSSPPGPEAMIDVLAPGSSWSSLNVPTPGGMGTGWVAGETPACSKDLCFTTGLATEPGVVGVLSTIVIGHETG